MSRIVARRFSTILAAEAVSRQRFAQGFVEEDMCLFVVRPLVPFAEFTQREA